MEIICNRENKLIQNSSELNDKEIYIDSHSSGKQFYINTSTASLRKDPRKAEMKPIPKPNINCLKISSSTTNKVPNTSSTKPVYVPFERLRYAPLNQTDFQLIYKLPSILIRIPQLYYIEQLRKLLAVNIQSYLV